jgi:hypothetical protein
MQDSENNQHEPAHNPRDTTQAKAAFQLVQPLVRRYLDAYYIGLLDESERKSILGQLEKLREFLGEERYDDAVYGTCELFWHAHESDESIDEFEYPGELWMDPDNNRVLHHPRPSNS